MDDRTPYPVRLDGALDPELSRWLWLVKWVLLVPHYLVLALLWPAAVVVWLCAGVSILVTGRYPAPLFDFEVGVLRWTWRVQHYGYGALGTDRYPPFTLADVPDHPAHFDVDRPGRLSRWLWLVKVLLAVPHLLVVGVFVGGGAWVADQAGADRSSWAAGGLVGLLVLLAGVVLLVRGRYPRGIYELVVGLDRWSFRVAAYLALTTDRYPPFRLDLGGTDPGSLAVLPDGPAPAGDGVLPARPAAPVAGVRPGTATTAHRWTGGRVTALVLGSLLLVGAAGLLVGGGALLWADRTQRDGGYVQSGTTTLTTSGYAVVGPEISLDVGGGPVDLSDSLGDTRVTLTSTSGQELFIGVAPAGAVAGYLQGVAQRRTGWDARSGAMGPGMMSGSGPGSGTGSGSGSWPGSWSGSWSGQMDGAGGAELSGTAPSTPPGEQDLWTASTTGTGTVVLDWTPQQGDWSVVVMRADGGAGIDAQGRAGATVPVLPGVAWSLLGVGLLLFVAGAVLVALAVRQAGTARSDGGGEPQVPPAPPVAPTPVAVDVS